MTTEYRQRLASFGLDTLPDIDVAVLGALELFSDTVLPELTTLPFSRPLVLGSGNAAVTGRLLFDGGTALFANENDYQAVLGKYRNDIDGAVIISASGGKHAVLQARELAAAGIRTVLYTNNQNAPAAAHVQPEDVHVFPQNREPYTYNTSTYLGMLLAHTKEDPREIQTFITQRVATQLPDTFGRYDAFFILVPPLLRDAGEMLRTKFDELFGAQVSVRMYTTAEALHAKTVVPSERECFLSFGVANTMFGAPDQRVYVPLPEVAGYAAFMAVGYYTVGRIQRAHPPYFKEHIVRYVQEASALFGEELNPIVA